MDIFHFPASLSHGGNRFYWRLLVVAHLDFGGRRTFLSDYTRTDGLHAAPVPCERAAVFRSRCARPAHRRGAISRSTADERIRVAAVPDGYTGVWPSRGVRDQFRY